MEFQQTTLSNGLTVIGEHNPQAKSVAVGYFVKTGSRDETSEISGVSHFLEHMMFKGSDTISGDEINTEFDEVGAKYNAFTNEELTAYHGAVLPEFQPRLVKLLTTMMRPALRNADFDVEKKVILEEIEMYKDRPNFMVFDELRPTYFGQHPLGNSVLGTSESIGALSRDAMFEYFSRRYAPNNLVLGVAGNYDWNALLAQVGEMTSSWTPATTGRIQPTFAPTSTVKTINSSKINRAHIALMTPGFSSTDVQRYAAGVLGWILGDGENSRLYWALVDNGLCDEASFDHTSEDGLGHFGGYISTDPDRAKEALAIYKNILEEAQKNGVTLEELERAKRKVAVSIVLRAETPYSRLFSMSMEYLDTLEYKPLDEVVKVVQSVTLEQVNAILETRPFDAMTVVGLMPDGFEL